MSVRAELRAIPVRRIPYRLARWSYSVSYWFNVIGDWLDNRAERF